MLKQQGDKVPAEDRTKLEDALKVLKDSLAGEDIDAVKRAHEALSSANQEFTTRLYQSAQAQQSATADAGATPPSDDDVADAEIVDDVADDEQTA
jgi:molecular chaperone DnaK